MSSSVDLATHRTLIEACLRNGVPFFWRGPGTMLISGRGLRDVILDVLESGEEILGLEGFELEGQVIHPRIDLIFDSKTRADPLAAIAQWDQDIWVDVMLRRKPAA